MTRQNLRLILSFFWGLFCGFAFDSIPVALLASFAGSIAILIVV